MGQFMGHSDRYDVALVISCDQVSARLGLARVNWHTCQSGSLSRGFYERNTTCAISDVNCRSVKILCICTIISRPPRPNPATVVTILPTQGKGSYVW